MCTKIVDQVFRSCWSASHRRPCPNSLGIRCLMTLDSLHRSFVSVTVDQRSQRGMTCATLVDEVKLFAFFSSSKLILVFLQFHNNFLMGRQTIIS